MPHPLQILGTETTILEANSSQKVPLGKIAQKLLWLSLLLVCAETIPVTAQTIYPLPPAEDIPEEVLRLEEPGYGNSMITGEKLNLGEYARLSAELQDSIEPEPQMSPKIKDLIFLLKTRKLLRTFLPFF
jgi:hypothetical protein